MSENLYVQYSVSGQGVFVAGPYKRNEIQSQAQDIGGFEMVSNVVVITEEQYQSTKVKSWDYDGGGADPDLVTVGTEIGLEESEACGVMDGWDMAESPQYGAEACLGLDGWCEGVGMALDTAGYERGVSMGRQLFALAHPSV